MVLGMISFMILSASSSVERMLVAGHLAAREGCHSNLGFDGWSQAEVHDFSKTDLGNIVDLASIEYRSIANMFVPRGSGAYANKRQGHQQHRHHSDDIRCWSAYQVMTVAVEGRVLTSQTLARLLLSSSWTGVASTPDFCSHFPSYPLYRKIDEEREDDKYEGDMFDEKDTGPPVIVFEADNILDHIQTYRDMSLDSQNQKMMLFHNDVAMKNDKDIFEVKKGASFSVQLLTSIPNINTTGIPLRNFVPTLHMDAWNDEVGMSHAGKHLKTELSCDAETTIVDHALNTICAI
ncbi:hypothetical protein IW261DRAFT_1418072 [Armillaria novae-zelandiae]|uniref:Uncharacterized protein n=1 Tax=Armillaria novae-zelandiae TaxID=153914 RepID=A0AA39UKG3_9AGAR|nr:hypothetical protein IW261DRAFT_1418072 [Armillaria novae-zelandiae]